MKFILYHNLFSIVSNLTTKNKVILKLIKTETLYNVNVSTKRLFSSSRSKTKVYRSISYANYKSVVMKLGKERPELTLLTSKEDYINNFNGKNTIVKVRYNDGHECESTITSFRCNWDWRRAVERTNAALPDTKVYPKFTENMYLENLISDKSPSNTKFQRINAEGTVFSSVVHSFISDRCKCQTKSKLKSNAQALESKGQTLFSDRRDNVMQTFSELLNIPIKKMMNNTCKTNGVFLYPPTLNDNNNDSTDTCNDVAYASYQSAVFDYKDNAYGRVNINKSIDKIIEYLKRGSIFIGHILLNGNIAGVVMLFPKDIDVFIAATKQIQTNKRFLISFFSKRKPKLDSLQGIILSKHTYWMHHSTSSTVSSTVNSTVGKVKSEILEYLNHHLTTRKTISDWNFAQGQLSRGDAKVIAYGKLYLSMFREGSVSKVDSMSQYEHVISACNSTVSSTVSGTVSGTCNSTVSSTCNSTVSSTVRIKGAKARLVNSTKYNYYFNFQRKYSIPLDINLISAFAVFVLKDEHAFHAYACIVLIPTRSKTGRPNINYDKYLRTVTFFYLKDNVFESMQVLGVSDVTVLNVSRGVTEDVMRTVQAAVEEYSRRPQVDMAPIMDAFQESRDGTRRSTPVPAPIM